MVGLFVAVDPEGKMLLRIGSGMEALLNKFKEHLYENYWHWRNFTELELIEEEGYLLAKRHDAGHIILALIASSREESPLLQRISEIITFFAGSPTRISNFIERRALFETVIDLALRDIDCLSVDFIRRMMPPDLKPLCLPFNPDLCLFVKEAIEQTGSMATVKGYIYINNPITEGLLVQCREDLEWDNKRFGKSLRKLPLGYYQVACYPREIRPLFDLEKCYDEEILNIRMKGIGLREVRIEILDLKSISGKIKLNPKTLSHTAVHVAKKQLVRWVIDKLYDQPYSIEIPIENSDPIVKIEATNEMPQIAHESFQFFHPKKSGTAIPFTFFCESKINSFC